jgi:hypothetical protein
MSDFCLRIGVMFKIKLGDDVKIIPPWDDRGMCVPNTVRALPTSTSWVVQAGK